jgi:aconitate hydratase
MAHSLFDTLQSFETSYGTRQFYSLPQLELSGVGPVSKLPVSIRIVLESVLRNCDGQKIGEDDVRTLANWKATAARTEEIPFVVARIVLQDFTGVPLLVDLAAMRSAAARAGKDAKIIEPLVPVDLVVDHSVQVDFSSVPDALRLNMEMEFKRNISRYQFLKWGMQAFDSFSVVPPGIGIVHQVNLEYLAKGVLAKDGIVYPDTLVGTDSHTTMINGLGIVGWGVGGIEAEAGMLGQPVYFLTPDVVGVNLTGALKEGVTATDLVLRVTEMLRAAKVVGKFVEFFGEGSASLSLPDRATIANMAPEYGATMGFFPIDDETCKYLTATGRTPEQVETFQKYFQAQGLYGMPQEGDIEYSQVLGLDLSTVKPSVAGPKRPQDRIELDNLHSAFRELLSAPVARNGYAKAEESLSERFATTIGVQNGSGQNGAGNRLANGQVDSSADGDGRTQGELPPSEAIAGGGDQEKIIAGHNPMESFKNTATYTEREMIDNRPTPDRIEASPELMAQEFPTSRADLGHGDVVIAAITSCTNTSNPSVMLAAGLVAKKAVEKGLKVRPTVKMSLAPGSRVVTEYLENTGLQLYLDELGFHTVGYGCTTCIGNSGPLDPRVEEVVTGNDLVVASVLSGNRNFEARVHQAVKANFLMSPPLVVAFALAGRVDIDMQKEPLGRDKEGNEVFLKDLWPSNHEVSELLKKAFDSETFKRLYGDFEAATPLWNEVSAPSGNVYEWDTTSTYIQEPPFFTNFSMEAGTFSDICNARPLAIFGDSVTTDHISPAGAIKPSSPAGQYLQQKGVGIEDFNSYGSRRGNDRVMTRGTFANVRIKNLMVPGVEGGVTLHQPEGEQMSIYDAAVRYQAADVPLVIFAGQEYGTGSSRDWAAKGTSLLGVKAVVAASFERIHRSNLVGMGVLPLQFAEGESAQSLGLDGSESFDITGLGQISPQQDATLTIHRKDGTKQEATVKVRIDTPIEVEYYRHGGILQYVLRQLMA